MKLTGFDHIVLCVSDVRGTLDFYTGILGMDAVEEQPGKWSLHFGEQKISVQDVGSAPAIASGTVPGSGNYCVLTQEPIAQIARVLQEQGVELVAGPDKRRGATGQLLSLYIRDPEGNLIEISNKL